MSKELTKEEFLSRLENRTCRYLYQVGVIATPNDNYVKYAYEYILEKELSCKKELKGIDEIVRVKNYKGDHSKSHLEDTNRIEEHIVMQFYSDNGKGYIKRIFGKILDYQVPMKNSNEDKGIKAIDFINLKNNILYLSEIKAPNSKESLLKAILEIQTYYQIVCKSKLKKDFHIDDNVLIKKSIVIYSNTKAYKQFQNNIHIKKLIDLFEIEVIVLENKGVRRVN